MRMVGEADGGFRRKGRRRLGRYIRILVWVVFLAECSVGFLDLAV